MTLTRVPPDTCPQCGSAHVLRNQRRTIECHDCNQWTTTRGKTGKMDGRFDEPEPENWTVVEEYDKEKGDM